MAISVMLSLLSRYLLLWWWSLSLFLRLILSFSVTDPFLAVNLNYSIYTHIYTYIIALIGAAVLRIYYIPHW